MRILFLVLTSLLLFMSCTNYLADNEGVTIKLTGTSPDVGKVMRLDVINDDIIQVRVSNDSYFDSFKSLVVEETSGSADGWSISELNDSLLLTTKSLRVKISLIDGGIKFIDKAGNVKLKEADGKSRMLKAAEIDGEIYYRLSQEFYSPDDEALYGLGQHQHGLMNYKGEDVELVQYNIVAVVPFLVSNKNYGIFWDNYSRTWFGDSREWYRLSDLKLYDEQGKMGGLTVRYYNDKTNTKDIFLEREESDIYYKYQDNLNDIPKDFNMDNGMVEWSGYLETDKTGGFKFKVYSSGYLKIWLGEDLLCDTWRQGWNPWSRLYKISTDAKEKFPVRIQWIPDASQAFFSIEWLDPLPERKQKNITFTSEAGKLMSYYFINGNNLDEVMANYRQLTGKSPIMPKWAMGLWQSRERYKTQEELLNVVREYRKRNIPLDNIVLDWHYWQEDKWGDHGFDSKRFPDPVGMINELHNELNAHIMVSVWAKYYENTENYKIMKDNGWLYMKNIENRQKDWVGPGYISTFYDAYSQDARKEFWKQLNDSLYSKGFDAWWLDATEPDILSNISIDERKELMNPIALGPSTVYFNAFSLMQTKGVYSGQRSVDPNKRVFILTRSAFAGQQEYAAATWSGDVASRWSDLEEQISAGLNISIAGIPYWTTDIGGFSLERRFVFPKGEDEVEWRELNLRWFQFGTFTPLFRVHGQFPFREIYNISYEGHPVYKSMVYYDKLRYRLMPYIYTLAGMTYHQDYTIMRPLVMGYSHDNKVLGIGDQYMFGPDLMVCPVYEHKTRNRKVYFPSGNGWYDLISGKYYNGGEEKVVDAPLKKIPVFVKEGAILPFGPEIQFTNEKSADPITVLVYTGKDGSFELYEDEDINYNYEKGNYSLIPFTYTEQTKELRIGKRQGEFDGVLTKRTFRIKFLTPGKSEGIDDNDIRIQTVKYSGEEIVVTFPKVSESKNAISDTVSARVKIDSVSEN